MRPGRAASCGWTGSRWRRWRGWRRGCRCRRRCTRRWPAWRHRARSKALRSTGAARPMRPGATGPQARASALALAAGPPGPPAHGLPQTAGRPGLRGATLNIEATERGGQAAVDGRRRGGAARRLRRTRAAAGQPAGRPGLDGRGRRATACRPPIVLTVRDVQLANADVDARLSGSWRTGPGTGFGVGQRLPGVIDLQGRLRRGDAARVARYLPLGVPLQARSYVARALTEGRVTGGEVAVQGDLWRFPFVDGGPAPSASRPRCRPALCLPAQRSGLGFTLAGDDGGGRHPGVRPRRAAHPRRAGADRRRGAAGRQGRHRGPGQPAPAAPRGPGPRPAAGDAALRQHDAGGRLDRRRPAPGQRQRGGRPGAGAGDPAGRPRRGHRARRRCSWRATNCACCPAHRCWRRPADASTSPSRASA
jgi:hypothetical protein